MTPRPGLHPSWEHLDAQPQNTASWRKQASLSDRLASSRKLSLELAQPLTDEDQIVQSMEDASPTKWHLAHTTWFYEADRKSVV